MVKFVFERQFKLLFSSPKACHSPPIVVLLIVPGEKILLEVSHIFFDDILLNAIHQWPVY